MKTALILIAIMLGAVSAQAQTTTRAGGTAAQWNTFLSPYSGTWNGSIIGSAYGGTGINNGSSTITLGGSLTTSGAFATTLTVTGATSVTLPTSGTLVNSGVTSLSSLAGVGTLTSGATGAGFTVALGTSTITGQLAIANGGTGAATVAGANYFFANTTGGTAPAFRAIVAGDIPTLNQNTTGTAAGLSSTLLVTSGGTGVTTMTTAYAPVCAGTTATGALQVASSGMSTSGYVLTSNGSSLLPTWEAVPSSTTFSAITADQTAAINTEYLNNKATTQLALTLPATAAAGSKIIVDGGSDAAGVKIVGILGSIFHAGTTTGVTGTAGYISSSDQYGSITIVCIVANTDWEIQTSSGSWVIN